MSRQIRLALVGGAGRMGRELLGLIAASPELRLAGVLEGPAHPWVGQPLAGLVPGMPSGLVVRTRLDDLEGPVDVAVDFSTPASTLSLLPGIRALGCGLVCGTTGFSAPERELIESLGTQVPLLLASNMSLGANLLFALARQASLALGPGFDTEVLELHHRHKKDSPSGTALSLVDAVLEPRGIAREQALHMRPHGLTGPRRGEDEVGVAALRGGDVVGDHTVYFLGTGERIELCHRVTDRRALALGALRAATWLAGRAAGRYQMADVLGFSS